MHFYYVYLASRTGVKPQLRRSNSYIMNSSTTISTANTEILARLRFSHNGVEDSFLRGWRHVVGI